jgi:hypothetical protein
MGSVLTDTTGAFSDWDIAETLPVPFTGPPPDDTLIITIDGVSETDVITTDIGE